MIPLLHDPALLAVLDALPQARLVGGCVRDTLAGRPVADIDLATPDRPDAVIAALAAAGLKSAPTGLQHGTVTAISDHRGFEVTTLRRDVVTDGRHAEVAWTDDWRVDAARRDFTMNAMFLSRDGEVFDFFEGRADLNAGRVRFVGDPVARITEDYLRILRFFRFQARYGRHPPEPATLEALRNGVPGLEQLSPERIWSEFKRILIAPDPTDSLRLMAELGVLHAILPETAGLQPIERLVEASGPVDPILRLAALKPDAAVADRWRFSVKEREELDGLAEPAPAADLAGAALRRVLADTAPETLIARSWLTYGTAGEDLRSRIVRERRPVFALAGRDALALGLSPGPHIGALIRDVRGWWLDGGCVASGGECRDELARRVASVRARG